MVTSEDNILRLKKHQLYIIMKVTLEKGLLRGFLLNGP